MWTFDEHVYKEKVYGGWLGKTIGGTLGGPVEGQRGPLSLTFYPTPLLAPLPNDDLDLQLVWLHALQQYGPHIAARHLAQEWLDHVRMPFDEYGYALYNLRRGLVPPVSGWYGNPFTDCMGSPIRSEIWAMVAPCVPELAAFYAFQDSIVDHAGGEGVWGEMFFAALESAAFVFSDALTLIDKGLSFIPHNCRVAKAVRDVVQWHQEGFDWQKARELVINEHGSQNFTDAPQNIAFTLIGWLYGNDFADCLLKAVNCGYDTDCTAATLGAILGIINGRQALPPQWVQPVGDLVVISKTVEGFSPPPTLEALTNQTLAAARKVLSFWDMPLEIAPGNQAMPTDTYSPKRAHPNAKRLTDYNPRVTELVSPTSEAFASLTISLDSGPDGPTCFRGEPKQLHFSLHNHGTQTWAGTLELEVPKNWQGAPEEHLEIPAATTFHWAPVVVPKANLKGSNIIYLKVTRRVGQQLSWSANHIPIYLIPKQLWQLRAPDGLSKSVTLSHEVINFDMEFSTKLLGEYQASTTIYSATLKKVRLIVATQGGLQVVLNNQKVLDDKGPRAFMPAFHRAPRESVALVELKKGANQLWLSTNRWKQPLQVMVAITPPAPGPLHPYLDVTIAPNPPE